MPEDQPQRWDRGWLLVSALIIVVMVAWAYTRKPLTFSWGAEYGLVVIAGLVASKARNKHDT